MYTSVLPDMDYQKLVSFDGENFIGCDVGHELSSYTKKVEKVIFSLLYKKEGLSLKITEMYNDLPNILGELNSFVAMFVERAVYVIDPVQAFEELSRIEKCVRDFCLYLGLNNDDIVDMVGKYALSTELALKLGEVQRFSSNLLVAWSLCIRILKGLKVTPMEIRCDIASNGDVVYYGELCFVEKSEAERFRLTQYMNVYENVPEKSDELYDSE